nr:MAG TPA: hypothetical protein [Bacteriophage sp.]
MSVQMRPHEIITAVHGQQSKCKFTYIFTYGNIVWMQSVTSEIIRIYDVKTV